MFCEAWWAWKGWGRCEARGHVCSEERISGTRLQAEAGIIPWPVGGTEVGFAAISRTPRRGVQTLGRGHDWVRRGCERLTEMASPRGRQKGQGHCHRR